MCESRSWCCLQSLRHEDHTEEEESYSTEECRIVHKESYIIVPLDYHTLRKKSKKELFLNWEVFLRPWNIGSWESLLWVFLGFFGVFFWVMICYRFTSMHEKKLIFKSYILIISFLIFWVIIDQKICDWSFLRRLFLYLMLFQGVLSLRTAWSQK